MYLDLSILTISRNKKNLLDLVNSIDNSKHNLQFEVLCAWNGDISEIDSLEFHFQSKIKLLDVGSYSFSRNNNALAKYAKGKTLLFINDDIVVDQNCIQEAYDALQKPDIGIVGANLRYPDDKLQHAGIFFCDDGTPYHRFKHEVHFQSSKVSKSMYVPAVTGAFIMIEASEFYSIEFNEGFETAGEDIVLCIQYKQKYDKQIYYEGNATAIHVENATRKLVSNAKKTPPKDLNKIRSFFVKQNDSFFQCKILIVTEKPGWIMHRKALEIQKRLPNVVINEDCPDADIIYYINYGYAPSNIPKKAITVANFTHFDRNLHQEKFIKVAREVDHCIAVSEATAKVVKELGIPEEKISVVIVGADTNFKPKLTLGIVGRVYPGGRKGEDLVKAVVEDPEMMSDMQIVASNEDWGVPVWDFEDRANFYRAIDYLLVPSRLEGGPVPFMEALACGTLAIAPPIGVVSQFPHVEYSVGDIQSLKEVIRSVKNGFLERRTKIAQYIAPYNWENWAFQHENIFRKLLGFTCV
jgi:glycosyltransferase involved in cell wall biosynthesis